MRRSCATVLLAACLATGTADWMIAAHAATGDAGDERPKKSRDPKDVLVPIPSYSKDVSDNGCHVRSSPDERFSESDAALRHVPFEALIAEMIGRYSVHATLDPPAIFIAKLDALDPSMRTLALLDVLHNGLGRDGLHTFFFMKAAAHAPAIANALEAAGLQREHAIFVKAIQLFGPDYPLADDERMKHFSYSSLDTPLNDFDRRMMDLAQAFGSPEAFARSMVAYVERTPALWQRIEAERAHLGEIARLRYLNQTLIARAKVWDTPEASIATKLAAMAKEQRTLLVMDIFNDEFENGGVHQFFLNSSGALAPEVYAAFLELELDRQAAIFKRGLDMFGAKYQRDTERRRSRFFDHGDWTDWDKRLAGLTDELYALDGGPTVVKLNSGAGIEGGPGIWAAMAVYARNKNMLPC